MVVFEREAIYKLFSPRSSLLMPADGSTWASGISAPSEA